MLRQPRTELETRGLLVGHQRSDAEEFLDHGVLLDRIDRAQLFGRLTQQVRLASDMSAIAPRRARNPGWRSGWPLFADCDVGSSSS